MARGSRADLVLLRHGPTDWNAEGRIQGRSDRPLSREGRARVRDWRIPPAFQAYDWATSPLRRARETAALLGHEGAEVVPELIETDWGQWEGERLTELRARLGESMVANEARGLDFRPPGGESPRDLQTRLAPWLDRVATAKRPCIAVAHKGVIRALYALATGWELRGQPPDKLRPDCAHAFRLSSDGRLAVARLNLTLLP
ncbi:MAG: histidine phosphatase family protein [Kiloniellales bacterium]|jgi:probable phosphoglycerate mutase